MKAHNFNMGGGGASPFFEIMTEAKVPKSNFKIVAEHRVSQPQMRVQSKASFKLFPGVPMGRAIKVSLKP